MPGKHGAGYGGKKTKGKSKKAKGGGFKGLVRAMTDARMGKR